ncbi:hypothetical protein [Dyella sp.]|uniref:hypothetical protein n=1 Tax=Dyella sp. TaxID=1869338 RepID=UPI002FDA5FAB
MTRAVFVVLEKSRYAGTSRANRAYPLVIADKQKPPCVRLSMGSAAIGKSLVRTPAAFSLFLPIHARLFITSVVLDRGKFSLTARVQAVSKQNRRRNGSTLAGHPDTPKKLGLAFVLLNPIYAVFLGIKKPRGFPLGFSSNAPFTAQFDSVN